jgi:hypothetical protein
VRLAGASERRDILLGLPLVLVILLFGGPFEKAIDPFGLDRLRLKPTRTGLAPFIVSVQERILKS